MICLQRNTAMVERNQRKQLSAEDYAIIERIWSLAAEDVETLDFYRMYKFRAEQLHMRSFRYCHNLTFLDQSWKMQYVWHTTPENLLEAAADAIFYVSLRRRGSKFRVALVCSAVNLRYTPEKVVDKTTEV